MYPELFHLGKITVYTYAFLIVIGSLVAAIYTKWRVNKELGIVNLSNNFFYFIFIAGFVGGKLFYYLERPKYFFNNPQAILHNFSGGFVFYGSFLTIVPLLILYLKKQKIPLLPMLDILAITTLIVHALGRLGCFFGGCCYGKPTDAVTGMVFPSTYGKAVHPTQLYEVLVLLIIMSILFFIKKRQQFKGQLFIIYLILYAIARNILELFRGDQRGYIIKDYLSHSQFIGILIIISGFMLYPKFKKYIINT